MSIPTRGTCPHDRGVFVWLGDGPYEGDQSDPRWGRYPWVHDTTAADGRGALEVCDLMTWALPVECGEMCACGHSSRMHAAAPGPLPAGLAAKPRPCECGCPDFRHRAEDLARLRRETVVPVTAPAAVASPLESPRRKRTVVQLELFPAGAV